MGNSSTHRDMGMGTIHLRIRSYLKNKHQQFAALRQELLEVLKEACDPLRQLKEFRKLQKLVETATSHDTTVPFIELESYVLATLQNSFTNGQEFLKSKRREFFCFARQNLLKHPEFIMSKVVRQLNAMARHLLEKFEEVPSGVVSDLMQLGNRLTKHIVRWFYGSKLLCGHCPLEQDETYQERLQQVYLSQLSEYLLFFEKSEKNLLARLRFKEIERETAEVDSNVIYTVRELRHADNPRKENLFPKNDQNSYDIILEYLERLARASLLTTKYKFICIIFETIPSLFMQSEIKRHKQSFAAKRTFCATPDSKRHRLNGTTVTGSFGRCFELENAYSQLLSTDSKRDLAKYLIVEWFKSTKMCIIQDVYLPLDLLQKDGYLDDVHTRQSLSNFMHALYECIGVRPDIINGEDY